jgi:hypothetical protein
MASIFYITNYYSISDSAEYLHILVYTVHLTVHHNKYCCIIFVVCCSNGHRRVVQQRRESMSVLCAFYTLGTDARNANLTSARRMEFV